MTLIQKQINLINSTGVNRLDINMMSTLYFQDKRDKEYCFVSDVQYLNKQFRGIVEKQ